MSAESLGRDPNPTDRSPGPNSLGRTGATSPGLFPLILGVVALILGGSAVGMALTHAGPTGPVGAPGTRAVVNQTSDGQESTILSTCGSYPGSNVSFAAKGPGTIVVTATVSLYLQINLSNAADVYISLWNPSTSCSPTLNSYVYVGAPCRIANYPSQDLCQYWPDISLVQTFPVPSAGDYTISVIGTARSAYSGNGCYFEGASVAGVFYPS
jgi:hypothetical protein